MDSDEGKLFIGGIAWDTTEDTLKDYFGKYGDVSETVIMKDKMTGRPRGFGFVVFSDPNVLDSVLQDRHTIDGRTVEAKRALSREEQQASSRAGNSNSARGGGGLRTKKIFVGGLPSTLTEDGFRQYFETYGLVTDVVIMFDQNTQRPRGFGFISFDTEDAVDRVLHKTYHDLDGKLVEVKRALPKDAQPGGGRSGYQGYGGSNNNTNQFDSRMELNRFGQSQPAAGRFSPYSGYGAAGYGYGGASSGISFGGYGGYGVGGYGGANAGFGGPAGAYGNPGGPNAAGFGGAGPGVLRNTWNNQTPSGYGAAGYGTGGPWGPPVSGGAASAAMAPNPSGQAGYGNQGYGYGNYGGSDGGYGAGGGRAGGTPNSGSGGGEQGGGVGYMGSGFGDANGNSGYSNSTWRSDPSQAAGGYGGGYGGVQPRQT